MGAILPVVLVVGGGWLLGRPPLVETISDRAIAPPPSCVDAIGSTLALVNVLGPSPAPVSAGAELSGPAPDRLADELSVTLQRGYALTGNTVFRFSPAETSDPRLDGTYTLHRRIHSFRSRGIGPAAQVTAGTWRIENDAGAWQGSYEQVKQAAGDHSRSTLVLTGEGEFEGLTAVIEVSRPDDALGPVMCALPLVWDLGGSDGTSESPWDMAILRVPPHRRRARSDESRSRAGLIHRERRPREFARRRDTRSAGDGTWWLCAGIRAVLRTITGW